METICDTYTVYVFFSIPNFFYLHTDDVNIL